MTEYKLIWASRLWSVTPPDGEGWLYVQHYVASNGNHTVAMMRVMQHRYPGLGYAGPILVPVSVTRLGGAVDVSVSDTSFRSCPSHNRSQKRQPLPSSPARKDAASDISGRRTPTPQHATSSASRPHGQRPRGPGQRKQAHVTTPAAKPHTAGWLGSASTSALAR